MSTVQLSGLNVIAFFVTDLERSADFFARHLGFKRPAGASGPGIFLRQGDLALYLEQVPQRRTIRHGAETEVCPSFAVASVKTAFEKLRAAGVTIVKEYVEFSAEFALFSIADPDGNAMEISGRP